MFFRLKASSWRTWIAAILLYQFGSENDVVMFVQSFVVPAKRPVFSTKNSKSASNIRSSTRLVSSTKDQIDFDFDFEQENESQTFESLRNGQKQENDGYCDGGDDFVTEMFNDDTIDTSLLQDVHQEHGQEEVEQEVGDHQDQYQHEHELELELEASHGARQNEQQKHSLAILQQANIGINNNNNNDNDKNHDESPTLEMLQRWTLDYLNVFAAMESISELQDFLDPQNFVSTMQSGNVVGPLNQKDYLNWLEYYYLPIITNAVPDLTFHTSGWHLDPHNPWRIWVVLRPLGTHTNPLIVPDSNIALCPQETTNKINNHQDNFILSGPELASFWWTPDGRIKWSSMGYVGDDYTGTNQGFGFVTGLWISLGFPRPFLEWLQPIRRVTSWFSQFTTSSDETTSLSASKRPRFQTPYSELPQWWHSRKEDLKLYMNIQR